MIDRASTDEGFEERILDAEAARAEALAVQQDDADEALAAHNEALEAEAAGLDDLAREQYEQALAAATSDDTRPDAGALAELLRVNGYNTVRAKAFDALNAVGSLPLDAIDAAVEFTSTACRRLKLNTDPQAAEALKAAEAELEYLRAIRRMRRDLGDLEGRLAARQRIEVPR